MISSLLHLCYMIYHIHLTAFFIKFRDGFSFRRNIFSILTSCQYIIPVIVQRCSDDTSLTAVLLILSNCSGAFNTTPDTDEFVLFLSADSWQQDLKLCGVMFFLFLCFFFFFVNESCPQTEQNKHPCIAYSEGVDYAWRSNLLKSPLHEQLAFIRLNWVIYFMSVQLWPTRSTLTSQTYETKLLIYDKGAKMLLRDAHCLIPGLVDKLFQNLLRLNAYTFMSIPTCSDPLSTANKFMPQKHGGKGFRLSAAVHVLKVWLYISH